MKWIGPMALTALILLSLSCSRNNIRVEGVVEGGGNLLLTLEQLDVNRTQVLDSLRTGNDGHFSFSLRLDGPELCILKSETGALINLLLAPDDQVHIRTSADAFGSDYLVKGSEESENIRSLVLHLDETRQKMDSLSQAAAEVGDPESPRFQLIKTAYAQTVIKQKRFIIRYLMEHLNDLSSVYALYQKYGDGSLVMGLEEDLQYFKMVADSLQVSHPDASLTQSLLADIRNQELAFTNQQKVNKLLEMAEEEEGLLDLRIPDRNGAEQALSDLKGQVILVVFWASSHNNSIEVLLQLRSTYEKYKAKGFEVYAISLDNQKISWIRTIDFNEFDWINVSELSYPNSRASMIYNVTALPASFLINRDGDIVARDLFGRRLETWLDNLL